MGARFVPIILTGDSDKAVEAVERLMNAYDDLEEESKRAGQKASSNFADHFNADVFGGFARDALYAVKEEFTDFVRDSYRLATDLQQGVANVASIKPEIDSSQVYRELREMQTRIPHQSEQLAESLYDIFSSINVTQAEGLELLEKTSRGATAAATDVKTYGAAVIGVMNAYGEEVERVDHIQDVFFNTVKNGVVTGAELASSLGVATQAAKNAGVDFDELGALIAGATKEGGPAAQNINNLANTLQKLPTKETRAALRDLKVEVIDVRTGGFRPFVDILTDLKARLDKLPPAVRAAKLQEIMPDAQARTGLQTLLSQLDFVKEALKQNREEAGAFGDAYQTMAQTNAVASALEENALRSLQQRVGERIIQNAAWVKSTEIVTKQINGQTAALDDAGSQTEKFANQATVAFAKVKASLIPLGGIVVQIGRANLHLFTLLGTLIIGLNLRVLEEGSRLVKLLVFQSLNAVVSLVNGAQELLEKVGSDGFLGKGNRLAGVAIERPDMGSDRFLKGAKEAFDQLVKAGQGMVQLGKEIGQTSQEIDRAVVEQKKLQAARDARLQQDDEAGRLGILGRNSSAVEEAQRLAEEQRARQAAQQSTGLSPEQLKAAMGEGTERRRKAQRVIDEADKWSINELRDIQEFFKSATGRALPISAYGQSRYHNKLGLDHRNAADVELNPKSREGQLLIQYLQQNQIPYRAFTGPYRNAQGVLTATGAHIHIGEPSHAFGKNVESRRLTRSDQLASLVLGGQLGSDMKVAPAGGQLVTVTPAQIDALLQRFKATDNPVAPVASPDILADTSRLRYEETDSQKAVTEYYAELRKRDEESAARRIFLAEYVAGRQREVGNEYYDRETSMLIDLGGREQELAELRRQRADNQLSEQRRLLAAKDEEIDLTRRLTELEDEYANVGVNAGLRQQIALREELLAIKRADVDAVESQVRSQVRLSDATTVHSGQVRARVLEHLASQKTATEAWADGITGAYDQVTSFIDRGLDRITGKLTILNELLKTFVHQLMNRVFTRFINALFPEPGREGGGASGGGASGGGFSLRNIVGGGGGTPTFSPSNAGGIVQSFRQGGLKAGLKRLFGFGSSAAGAAASSAAPAVASSAIPALATTPGAGIASVFGGGTAAAVFGGGAGTAAGAGGGAAAGGTAAGGGSMFSSMGALFTNPWTAVVAGAAIGGFMLWNHFRNRTEKELRKAIEQEYQVNVKDMAVLKQVKEIGEGVFGRGQVRKHLLATIKLDAAKELIAAYAEQTGQNSSRLVTSKQLADPTNPLNNFARREFGGPVAAGVPYIVGERRPEVFVPDVAGRIVPSVQDFMRNARGPVGNVLKRVMDKARAQLAKQSASAAPSSTSPARAGSGGNSQAAAIAALAEAVAALNAKIKGMRPGDVVGVGAEENPEAIGRANNAALKSGSVRQEQQERLGMRS